MKEKIVPWPWDGCVYITQEHSDRGPRIRWRNPVVGWRVYTHHEAVGPVFPNLKEAKAWADERYEVCSWERLGKDGYRANYIVAIPKGQPGG